MKQRPSTLSTFWAVLWRSVVLLPVSALFLVAVCGAAVLVLLLPISAVVCAWSAEWWRAVGLAIAWVPAFAFLRWWWRRERGGHNWSPF